LSEDLREAIREIRRALGTSWEIMTALHTAIATFLSTQPREIRGIPEGHLRHASQELDVLFRRLERIKQLLREGEQKPLTEFFE
jgi:hypothetical protein